MIHTVKYNRWGQHSSLILFPNSSSFGRSQTAIMIIVFSSIALQDRRKFWKSGGQRGSNSRLYSAVQQHSYCRYNLIDTMHPQMAFRSPSDGALISPIQQSFETPSQTKVSGDRQRETTHGVCCYTDEFLPDVDWRYVFHHDD